MPLIKKNRFINRTIIANFILLFCVFACKQAEKEDGTIEIKVINGSEVTTCDLSKVSSKEDLKLSDILEDFEIIHLEDANEAFFKAWLITVTDGYIGIRQYGGKPFKLFDRKGNFLNDIGKEGNGPGEYSISFYDEIIDEENRRIYFSSIMGDKIMVYGLDGNHIKDIKLPFSIQKPKIQLTKDGYLTIAHMPFDEDEFFTFQIDLEGNILKGTAPREDMRVFGYDSELFSFRNTADVDIYHTEVDTLYHLNPENLEITPKLTSTKLKEGWLCLYKELPDRYLFNTFNYQTNESQMISARKGSKTSSQIKLVNNYLGNLEMEFSFNKGYFIQNFEPAILIEKIETHLSNTRISSEDKDKLKTLLNTLDENQNNVLMIGKLKKF